MAGLLHFTGSRFPPALVPQRYAPATGCVTLRRRWPITFPVPGQPGAYCVPGKLNANTLLLPLVLIVGGIWFANWL